MRRRRWVPPAPGIIPRLVSVRPIWLDSEASRKSHASASSHPPPNAYPSMAAMTGFGILSKRLKTSNILLADSNAFTGDVNSKAVRSARR